MYKSVDFININSAQRDRKSNSSSSNFGAILPDYLEGKYKLAHASIPLSYHNVSEYDVMVIETEGKTYNVTLEDGHYYYDTICLTLAGELKNTIGGEWEVEYALNTFCVILKHDKPFRVVNVGEGLSAKLGFTFPMTPKLIIRSDEGINLCRTRYICVRMNKHQEFGTIASVGDYTFMIPIGDKQFGDMVEFSEKTGFDQYIHIEKPTRVLEISIHDDSNDFLNLNGKEWNLILKKV